MKKPPTRRDVAQALAGAALAQAAGNAFAQTPLPRLPALAEADALFIQPSSADYAAYNDAYNRRTLTPPRLRALCRTARGVAAMVNWCRDNRVPFALRSGGHSFEGFSQSADVVIDVRQLDHVRLEAGVARVGSGATLGKLYRELWAQGLTVPAGTCTSVGVAGHALGGGYGLLARAAGLTCDRLVGVTLVNAQGRVIDADAQQNADLFWACRGGGGGSFGAVTELRFRPMAVDRVTVFGLSWTLAPERAAALWRAWLGWAPQAPREITCVFKFARGPNGNIAVRVAGQSLLSVDDTTTALSALTALEQPRSRAAPRDLSFMQAINRFGGGEGGGVFMKGRSDYIAAIPSEANALAVMQATAAMETRRVAAICDAYGGAIAETAVGETAFAHRAMLCSVQYHASWDDDAGAPAVLAGLDALYAAMRPCASGRAYLNYCDLDQPNWANAYWAENLARLQRIKTNSDPANLFRHAQSVPLQ